MNYPCLCYRSNRCLSAGRSKFLRRGQSLPSGLTLIELLVVIGIIAVLSVILIPALNRSSASARSVVCASNMRQIGTAMHTYANEHNDTFPSVSVSTDPQPWTFRLAPYLDIPEQAMGFSPRPRAAGVFICPDLDEQAQQSRLISYAYNKYITRGQWNHSRTLVTQPARTFLVVEVRENIEIRGMEGLVLRHPSHYANFLFADGHVESISSTDVDDDDSRWKWW